ncbi:MAG: hypothetical protein KAH05_04430, partial [Clostridiales bacterium]|nr:hypothetical protein [Clostridiales bacterium]
MRDFNFFEPYIYTRKTKNAGKNLTILFTIVLLGAIGGFYYWNMQTINSLEADIGRLDGEIAVFNEKGVMEKKNALEEEKSYLEERVGGITEFEAVNKSEYIITDELISDVVGLIPRDMYFESMDIGAGSISMSGFAYDRAVIAEYEYALRDSKHYDEMHVAVILEGEESDRF